MNRPLTSMAAIATLALATTSLSQVPRPMLLPKQIAAPPADILDGTVRLPALGDVAIDSTYARIPVVLERDADGGLSWTGSIPIDDGADVRMVLLQPNGSPLAWEVTPPASAIAQRTIAPAIVQGEVEGFITTPAAEMRAFPVSAGGDWTVRVRATQPVREAAGATAWLFVATDSPHALRSSVDTLNHIPGGTATITADLRTDARTAETAMLTRIVVHLDDRTLEMADDGHHGDGAADDGVYGITIPLERIGAVEARIEATGITDSGNEFIRTIDHRIAVAPGGIAIAPGAAVARVHQDAAIDASQLRIDIPVAFEDPTRRVLIAAEVWGIDPATGLPAPAVWAAMITEPHALDDGSLGVSLYIDPHWVATSAIAGPFELRSTRTHDIDTFVPVAVREVIPLIVPNDLALPAAAPRAISEAMRSGTPRPDLALALTLDPEDLSRAEADSRAVGAHNLMLSHGYCAGAGPFPAGDFTGFKEVFADPDQNRTHDQFAQLLLTFGFNSKSYGIVAHSQGGCAALHLSTFYFSGLDWAEGPRLIQSLGTPYQGTPLASLGGFTCGVNNDMTPDGAAAWLSTIPNANRAAVYYWTTYSSGSACDFFSNLLLSGDDDGVVQVARGQLPGANNMGSKSGWCHTTGMSYPAHYTDAGRNAELNSSAAR